jgi:hypothetical protein
MIYGDWEEGYEKLPTLFNAIKAKNPGMHYEYIPKPNEWRNGREIFFRAFWCFSLCVEAFRHYRPMLSIDGTFCLGSIRAHCWLPYHVTQITHWDPCHGEGEQR